MDKLIRSQRAGVALFFSGIIFFLGTGFTFFLSLQIKTQIHTTHYETLKTIGQHIRLRTQESIDLAIKDIRALQAFYTLNENITLDQFNHYTDALLKNSHEHIQALEWIPFIQHHQRDTFERAIQATHPNFQITEHGTDGQLISRRIQKHYYPVAYTTPYHTNQASHGFDLNSHRVRRDFLEWARDSGHITTTPQIYLTQETTQTPGFLVFAPVYRHTQPLIHATQRTQALRGFVLGTFRMDRLMQSAQQQADQNHLVLALYDQAHQKETPLYGAINTQDPFLFELSLPQRTWQLHIALNQAVKSGIENPSIIHWIRVGGSLLSSMLALCYYALTRTVSSRHQVKQLNHSIQRHNTQLERMVAERTETLAKKNQILEKSLEELTSKRKILIDLMEDTQTAKKDVEQHAIELARSNQDLDDFAYVASHDLKAPLRGIDQLANWVSEDLAAGHFDEIPENLRMMRQRIQRLERLLEDLLTYSRVGKQKTKRVTVNCMTLAQDLFTLNAPPPEYRLQIVSSLPTFDTFLVPFEQVLRNLFSNAIKHRDQDKGLIQIGCSEDDLFYTFAVQDDGPGIDPSHHAQIFKMFKALRPRDEVEGSGMGLALIKKIVECYGGRVYLESELGSGSTFSFTWPKTL